MRNIKININVTFTETDEAVSGDDCVNKIDDGSFSVILDSKHEFDIDGLESAMLRVNYPAIRDAISRQLEKTSKKKAVEQIRSTHKDGTIEEHPCLYKVDGEIGRFEFKTFDVKSEEEKMLSKGIDFFPAHKGRECYLTRGHMELALFLGAAKRSYRQSVVVFNRSRYQESGGTPLNTLCDNAHREGLKVLDFITHKTKKTFQEHKFTSEGVPDTDCSVAKEIPEASYLGEKGLQTALTSVCSEMSKKGFSPDDITTVRKSTVGNKVYENPEGTVYVHIDDVGVKKQKEHRDKKPHVALPEEDQPEKTKTTRPCVQNTVARIEHKGSKGFTLTGRSVFEVLKYVLAVLLCNNLVRNKIVLCTDGQKSLQNAIVLFFSWHTQVLLILDWFHIVKKFKEDLSLACKGREIRNNHLRQILHMLWFGLIDNAQNYITAIPMTDIKSKEPINRLVDYLERNRERIPCYAMRSRLKLPNSSNPVERSNNIVTAMRQKRNGMSWSNNGSYALTALNAVVVNESTHQWVTTKKLSFLLVRKAA